MSVAGKRAQRGMTVILSALATITLGAAAQAACPSTKNIAKGYYLEGGSARSEVRHIGEHFVQARTAYSDGVVQTDLYYDGLFAISRVSSRGAQMIHGADFDAWKLEMKKGAKAAMTYTPVVNSDPKAKVTVEMEVKGSEAFKLGACSYDVMVIELVRRSGKKERRYEQLYSPLLKFVVARRYPNGDLRAYRGVEAMQ